MVDSRVISVCAERAPRAVYAVRAGPCDCARPPRICQRAVAVRNSHHFGAAGYYVRRAAEAGLLALATSTTRTPVVSATGGTTPVLDTNPLAFAAPRSGGSPLVIDMSTSVVAMNKAKAYALRDEELPPDWVGDRSGIQLVDAAEAFQLLTHGGAMIDPGQLRMLALIERHGTLTAAAHALGLSPAAVTQQVARAERESKASLVLRGPRGATLTEAGTLLAGHGRVIDQQTEEA
ncbi:Ldh family oxidoreductase [Streptomyces sp. S465]|uniref:Ldh family oxidoreductase n=1 Tax=Streptomyces sp. S465 TaxID=2979468 RepID=UPI0022A8937A|nr:Ldh family oxidoreductase [Streptomyces sp. S465]WAP55065.1 Ldh family oxidoreductase [Streptomyces sp. S465]